MVVKSVFPSMTGSFATMVWIGVVWVLPPYGISTVPAPMELSNISTRPFLEQIFRSDSVLSHTFLISSIFSCFS